MKAEKTVAEAREALRRAWFGERDEAVQAVESIIRAILAESLPAQPKADAGEPRTFDATLYGPGPGNAPAPERVNAVARELLKEPSGEAPSEHDWMTVRSGVWRCRLCNSFYEHIIGAVMDRPIGPCWGSGKQSPPPSPATVGQPAASGPALLFPDHAPDCLKQKGAMRLQGMPGVQTFIRCTCGKEAEKPSGGAPSDEELSLRVYKLLQMELDPALRLSGGTSATFAFESLHERMRRLVAAEREACWATRDAEVLAYEHFVAWVTDVKGLGAIGLGQLEKLRSELAALEAKGKP